MRIIITSALMLFVLTSCDKHFEFQGTVISSTGKPLTDCTATIKSWNFESTSKFNPPVLDELMLVDGSEPDTNVTIQCAGHEPYVVDGNKNDGDLGQITLVPRNGA